MSTQPIGLDAALSRIEQIRSYQAELLDPSLSVRTSSPATPAAVSAPPTSSGPSGLSTSSSSTSSDFASLLSALQAVDGSATTGGVSLSGTDSTLPSAVQDMTAEANSLLGKPYLWGGGHSGWGASAGYDCSGFVSAVLHAGGYLSSPQDSNTLPDTAGIESGAGRYVTIYDRSDGYDGQAGHVIIDINGQFYESGGEPGPWGGGGGVEKIDRPSAAYLATFNNVLHPSGL